MLTAKELINQLINEDSYDDIEFNSQTNPLFNAKVLRYLEQKLDSLKIRLPFQKQPERISDLMKNKSLEGWCWQTTETTILFLDDDAYIERGHIILYPCTYYWHSWICFKFKGKTYVFDPCLQKLIPKDLYYKNSRPKEIEIAFAHGGSKSFKLKDRYGMQQIDFDEQIVSYGVTVTIKSVYKGKKYKDTVISEIEWY